MSRRKRRPAAADAEPAPSHRGEAPSAGSHSSGLRSSKPRSRRLLSDLAILTAVFAVSVGVAELAGAANLGVAIGVGQVTFAVVLVALLLRA